VPDRPLPSTPLAASADPGVIGLGWQRELPLRMRRLVVLKTLGICVFMWIFFVLYFHLLRHPAAPVVQMPLTVLDRAIPFNAAALAPYVSLWLYVGIPPGLLLSLRELLVYGLWAAALCIAGLLCFYFWPTAVPPMAVEVDLARNPAFAVLQGVDAAGNACPSLHVATAVFSAWWLERLLRDMRAPAAMRWLNLAWVLLITWSTLATKQHVVLDAVAGAALGTAFAWLSLRLRPRT
jgi:hypothetical protein